MTNTTFDPFFQEYDKRMGDTGDYTHQNTIDPALFEAIGNVKGKIIYDIGCGNGYIARKFIKQGAKEIWASDISPSMIEAAIRKYPQMGINYLVRDALDFKDIPENYFDLIIMNMVIHYISNLDKFFNSISKSLKQGGAFVFTTDHPFHSLSYFDIEKINNIEEVLEDARNYTKESVKDFPNHWDKNKRLRVYRRPFSTYINLLSKYGLFVNKLIEPPTKRTVDYENTTPLYSPIPFKFAMKAKKV